MRCPLKKSIVAKAHLAAIVAVALAGAMVPRPAVALAPVVAMAGEHAAPAPPARRQRELEELRRQDVARDLQGRGVTVSWKDHGLAELLDWRDRVDAARALASDFGVRIDWRTESAAALTDMRLRAAKAAEMRASFGILVDWRRYSWAQIEKLRISLVALHPAAPSGAGAGEPPGRGVATDDKDALAPFDPNRRLRRPARNPRDRDAIMEPLFASALPARAARRFAAQHPDGILEPTFSRPLPRPSDRRRDALIEPWR